jgi:outer membrane protein OmpA-like peptidoglycan-associated protein
MGAQGPAGPQGAQGRVGVVGRWTAYRDFTFRYARTDVPSDEMSTVSEIASYMAQNPSLRLGIDGSGNENLSGRRVDSVRDALIQAGVPAYKIQMGAFGDPQLRRDRRVAVLLSSSR